MTTPAVPHRGRVRGRRRTYQDILDRWPAQQWLTLPEIARLMPMYAPGTIQGYAYGMAREGLLARETPNLRGGKPQRFRPTGRRA